MRRGSCRPAAAVPHGGAGGPREVSVARNAQHTPALRARARARARWPPLCLFCARRFGVRHAFNMVMVKRTVPEPPPSSVPAAVALGSAFFDDDELVTNPPTPCQIGKRPPAPKTRRKRPAIRESQVEGAMGLLVPPDHQQRREFPLWVFQKVQFTIIFGGLWDRAVLRIVRKVIQCCVL